MTHEKFIKRGKSLYLDNWNPSAKRFILTCALCGKTGYSPAIEEPDFCENLERKAIYSNLTKCYSKLELDESGRCDLCAKIQDKIL